MRQTTVERVPRTERPVTTKNNQTPDGESVFIDERTQNCRSPSLSEIANAGKITTPTLMGVDAGQTPVPNIQLCQLAESSIYLTTRPPPQHCRSIVRGSSIPLYYSITCRMMFALVELIVLGIGSGAAAAASPAFTARSATNVGSPFIGFSFYCPFTDQR